MRSRIGRPKLDNPKSVDVKVRIDEQTNKRLLECAEKNSVSRTEIIRRGIELVLDSYK